MTSKERVKIILSHREADRVPKYDAFWKQTQRAFLKNGLSKKIRANEVIEVDGLKRTIGDPIKDYFGFDFDVLYIDTSLRMICEVLEEHDEFVILKDRYGFTVKKFKDKSGSMQFIDHITKDINKWDELKSRMKLNKSDKSRIDSISYFMHSEEYPSWEGFKSIYDRYRSRQKYMLFACYGVWEGTWRHHGFEDTMMDAMLNREVIIEMFEYYTDLVLDTLQYSLSIGAKPDGLWIMEDLGGTHTTLISKDMYIDMIKPFHKKMAEYCHENSMKLFMHSCGNIEEFIPEFIDAGIDVLQAIQTNTGMDVVKLKEKYGEDIVFFGNIGEQKIAGTKEDIYNEISYKIPNAMKNGGYIYHSDHSIPDEVSLENYEYLMKLVDEFGAYKNTD